MSQLPYPGLRPFRQDEADIFFGRDEQVQQLLDKLQGKRFLAVVGQSGCGKSSLIFTGLLNALDAGMLPNAGLHWRVANLHPGEHPMLNLAKALVDGARIGADFDPAKPMAETSTADTTAVSGNNPIRHDPAAFLLATLKRGPLGIVEALREKPLPADTNLLILVDQFEEIFRYRKHHDRDEADAFIALLLRTVSESLANAAGFPVYVVITMRSDFLGDCALFPNLPEALNDSQFLTPRLSRDQRRMAIIGPAKVFGGDVEPVLVNRLLNDMGADPDQLPVLQHALMRLWTQALDSGGKPVVLKLKDYEELGGWDNTLSNHADAAYNELNPGQHVMAETLFKALSERSAEKRDTRRPATLQTIADIAQVKPEELVPVIEVFRKPGRSFLKPPPPQALTPETLIDISHESLIRQWQSMKGWVIQEAQSADTYRRLEQTALMHEDKRADYLKGLELEAASTWKKQAKPNDEWAKRYGQDFELAIRFLEASEVMEKVKHIGKILLIAVVVVTAIAMTYLKQQADFEKRKVESWRLLADAERIRTHDSSKYPLSALLAIEAEKIFPEPSHNLNQFLLDSIGLMEKPLHALPHQDEVSLAVYSPDGKRLATVDGEKTVRLWEVAGGKELHTLNHNHSVTAVIFSPDGQKLASVSDEKIVRLWDAGNGQELSRLSHGGYVNSVSFSPDGKKLASGSDDKAAHLWDTVSGKELKRLKHSAPVKAVAFNKDGSLLATAGADNFARLWDVISRKEVKKLAQEDSVNAVGFSPNGKWLATASSDRTVQLWEVASPKLKPFKTLNHNYSVTKVIFSPDSLRLATSTDDKTIWLWEAVTRNVKETQRLRHDDYVADFGFSPDSRQIATASYDKTARIWPVGGNKESVDSKEIKRLNHDDVVTAVSFSADSRQLATASLDKTVKLWSSAGGQEFKRLTLNAKGYDIVFIPNGQQVGILNRETDGSSISISLRNLADGKEFQRFSQDIDISAFSFSPDGERLATLDVGKILHLWDVAGNKEINRWELKNSVKDIKFSPDGKKLGTIDENKTIQIWDAVTGIFLRQLAWDSVAYTFSFSPDGKWLATAHQDNSLRLWDIANTKEIRRFDTGDYVYDIDFSPDGEKIAAACHDNVARLWKIADGKEDEHLHHSDNITAVRFSPEGNQLLTASSDNTVRLWDSAEGKEMQIMHHPKPVAHIAFSPDGQQVITRDDDGVIRFWHWKPEDLTGQLCGKLSHNFGWGEWQAHFEGQPYRKTCTTLPVKNDYTETGRKLVASGKTEEARRMISELNAAYPELSLDPVKEINKYSAPELFAEAIELRNQNKIKEAAAKYYQVEEWDNTVITADDWNNLCWDGAMRQVAADVITACDKAVTKASEHSQWKYRDSRGIARALTGDSQGAIEDFEFFIKESNDRNELTDYAKQRREWISTLKAGNNPLTKGVLESIKDQ